MEYVEYSLTSLRPTAEELLRAADLSSLPYQMGQLELFSDEEEQYIQQEVQRRLHDPKLKNAGPRERIWLEKLKAFAKDESLVVTLKMAAKNYASAIESLLPQQEYIRKLGGQEGRWLTLPGFYYTRKDVTAKTNNALFTAAKALKQEHAKDLDKRWLADFLLEGIPEAVANFKIECLYLLRGVDGNVTRLVRLVNTLGEVSKGPEVGGTCILPAVEFSSAEKFRAWCISKGNFNWGVGGGAGNIELQMLHSDVSSDAAYRVAKLVEYVGWHPVKELKIAADKDHCEVAGGIWFKDECAFTSSGELLMPDADGVIHHAGEIYVLARKGREADYAHGRPKMRPNETLDESEPWLKSMESVQTIELDKKEWDPDSLKMAPLSGFFRETCRRFHDAAGGLGGFMSVGTMMGYAVGPEFFDFYGCLPSLFLPGQMGSGKTFYANWLMGLQGYQMTKGLGLGKGSRVTPVGLCQQLENHSSMALWFDEYRQHEISDEKVSIIRDSYDRQLAGKWTPDGVQRVIRTTPLVSGETDTDDPATRSRYAHQQISRTTRIGNHMNWMRDNRQYFFLFWRHVMSHRPEYVKLVMELVGDWMSSADTKSIPERSRVTHSLPFAAFVATATMLNSHTPKEIAAYRRFMIARAAAAAEDIDKDVYVNAFIQDVITAFKADEILPEHFRLKKTVMEHPPDAPNQGLWVSYELYMDPHSVISALHIFKRKANLLVPLKYNDLRDQLSKCEYWVSAPNGQQLNKRFGVAGSRATTLAWGFKLDLHPLGLQKISDEIYKQSLSDRPSTIDDIGPVFKDSDPRKGDLFAIVEAVEKFERKQEEKS